MTRTTLRRSATAVSALALAAVLGTPAYADSDNASGNAATAQAAHGPDAEPDDHGSTGGAPVKADATNATGGYRGKSPSTPDQDGVGMDRGLDNNDKTGPGTDGNNGCGNDDDREDDNNGWCGRKPKKPATVTADVVVAPRAISAPLPAPAPAPVAAAAPVVAPAPAVAPALRPAPRVLTAVAAAPVRPAAQVAGVRITRPAATVSAAPTLQDVTLPFTGSSTRTLIFLGVMTIAAGAVITELGRTARNGAATA